MSSSACSSGHSSCTSVEFTDRCNLACKRIYNVMGSAFTPHANAQAPVTGESSPCNAENYDPAVTCTLQELDRQNKPKRVMHSASESDALESQCLLTASATSAPPRPDFGSSRQQTSIHATPLQTCEANTLPQAPPTDSTDGCVSKHVGDPTWTEVVKDSPLQPALATTSTTSTISSVLVDSSLEPSANLSKACRKQVAMRHMFGLPETSHFIDYYHCALRSGILLQGRVYLFDTHFCFRSNIFGIETFRRIAIGDVTSLKKAKNVGIPNTIVVEEQAPTSGYKRHVFTSFVSRHNAFAVMEQLIQVRFGQVSK